MENQKPNFEELGKQLSHPSGETGIQVAEMMHKSNAGMIVNTIDSLSIKDNSHVLELGHANCGFLGELLSKAHNIRYSGLEISETMSSFCTQEFSNLIAVGNIDFKLYDGTNIPYGNEIFDNAFCVNTIYFWENPEALLTELLRILKPGGKLAIGFAYKSFMGNLPFVNNLFHLYESEEITELLDNNGFSNVHEQSHREEIEGKYGELVTREYGIVIGYKPENKLS